MTARRTRTFMAVCAFLGLASGLAPGAAARAAEPAPSAPFAFTVNSSADGADPAPSDGVCSTAEGTCTLRAALGATNPAPASGGTAAPPTVTVTLPAGTIQLVGKALAAADGATVTVTGAGRDATVIDASEVERAFDVTGGALTLADLTITGGTNPVDGGAVVAARDSAVTLRSVTVQDASSEGDGAAVMIGGGSLTVIDANFAGNAGANGGAVAAGGTAVDISGSRFTGNGSARHGGALFLSYPSSLRIRGTTFTGNAASGQGGAVYLDGFRAAPGQAEIAASFEDNSAVADGGALAVRTTGAGPTEAVLTLAGGHFSGNRGSTGGAVALSTGRLKVDGTSFTGNRSTVGAGGAIAAAGELAGSRCTFEANEAATTGGAIASVGRLSLDSCTFRQNRSAETGAALALTGVAAPEVRNSRFEDNVAGSGAGAVWRSGTGLTQAGNTFSGNLPAGADVESADPVPFVGGASGAAEAGGRTATRLVGGAAAALLLAAVGALLWLRRRRRRPSVGTGAPSGGDPGDGGGGSGRHNGHGGNGGGGADAPEPQPTPVGAP